MSVGYSTLYGDMLAVFVVLKDVPKTMVYRLANYRNKISAYYSANCYRPRTIGRISRKSKDEDSLPPYPLLDDILERYIERDQGFQQW